MRKNAFTLVEIIITLVILFLVVTMAIPAFENVKKLSILRAGDAHQPLSTEDYETYLRLNAERHLNEPHAIAPVNDVPVQIPISFQKIVIGDKSYYLFSKTELKEITIAGKDFYLIPTP